MAFEAFHTRARLLRLVILASLCFGFGLWVLSVQSVEVAGRVPRRLARLADLFDSTPLETLHGIGVVLVFVSVALLVLVGSYWLQREPVVRVDSTGVFFHRWSLRVIPWQNIASAKILIGGFVALNLHDRSASPPDTLFGWFQRLSPIRVFGDIPIDISTTDRKPQELLSAIADFSQKPR